MKVGESIGPVLREYIDKEEQHQIKRIIWLKYTYHKSLIYINILYLKYIFFVNFIFFYYKILI